MNIIILLLISKTFAANLSCSEYGAQDAHKGILAETGNLKINSPQINSLDKALLNQISFQYEPIRSLASSVGKLKKNNSYISIKNPSEGMRKGYEKSEIKCANISEEPCKTVYERGEYVPAGGSIGYPTTMGIAAGHVRSEAIVSTPVQNKDKNGIGSNDRNVRYTDKCQEGYIKHCMSRKLAEQIAANFGVTHVSCRFVPTQLGSAQTDYGVIQPTSAYNFQLQKISYSPRGAELSSPPYTTLSFSVEPKVQSVVISRDGTRKVQDYPSTFECELNSTKYFNDKCITKSPNVPCSHDIVPTVSEVLNSLVATSFFKPCVSSGGASSGVDDQINR